MLPMPVVDWKHPGVKKILALMGPAIFGRFGQPDQFVAGYNAGYIPAHWQCLLALLFGSPVRVAPWGFHCGHRHGDTAQSFPASCCQFN